MIGIDERRRLGWLLISSGAATYLCTLAIYMSRGSDFPPSVSINQDILILFFVFLALFGSGTFLMIQTGILKLRAQLGWVFNAMGAATWIFLFFFILSRIHEKILFSPSHFNLDLYSRADILFFFVLYLCLLLISTLLLQASRAGDLCYHKYPMVDVFFAKYLHIPLSLVYLAIAFCFMDHPAISAAGFIVVSYFMFCFPIKRANKKTFMFCHALFILLALFQIMISIYFLISFTHLFGQIAAPGLMSESMIIETKIMLSKGILDHLIGSTITCFVLTFIFVRPVIFRKRYL